jgi:hypothetical protein
MVRPEEFRLEHQCTNCGSWTLVAVTGSNRELAVEPRAAPAVRELSEDVPIYGEAAMNAVSIEAQAVVAFMADVRKMRQLDGQRGTLDPALAAETKALHTQVALSLQRQRRILESMLDRGEGTAEDRKVVAEFIKLIVEAQAELKVGTFEAMS